MIIQENTTNLKKTQTKPHTRVSSLSTEKMNMSEHDNNSFNTLMDASLGNYASFVASKEYQGFQRILNLEMLRQDVDIQGIKYERRVRYKLLHTARKSLLTYAHKTHRMTECHYGFIPGERPTITSKQNGSSWHNVKKCNNVFCPVCSVKVGYEQRTRLAGIVAQAYREGYEIIMMTLTGQHSIEHTSEENVFAMHNAWRTMTQSRAWRELCDKHNFQYLLRSTDSTFSPINGSHHHFHVLLVVDGQHFDACDWQRDDNEEGDIWNCVTDMWIHALNREGRTAKRDVMVNGQLKNLAVDFQVGDQYVTEYIAKHGVTPKESRWDITSELTLHTVKKAVTGHYTLFELLILSYVGDTWASSMYADYCDAMHNRNRLRLSDFALELEERMPAIEEFKHDLPDNNIPDFQVTREAWRVARNDITMRSRWLALHEQNDSVSHTQLMFEVAQATIKGMFLYGGLISQKSERPGWHIVGHINMSDGIHNDIGRVLINHGEIIEVELMQAVDSKFFGRWLTEEEVAEEEVAEEEVLQGVIQFDLL